MTPVAFMFPGVGDQYAGMTHELYEHDAIFRAHMDRCFEGLAACGTHDIKAVLYPERKRERAERTATAADSHSFRGLLSRGGAAAPDEQDLRLGQTASVMPAAFAVEYSMAQFFMSRGIQPAAMIGFSLGEYVAACLAGVISLEDALRLVSSEARMIAELGSGAMLAVALPEAELMPLMHADLSISAVNTPAVCVVSGSVDAVGKLQSLLAARGAAFRPVRTTHAFHSEMIRPVVEPFRELVRTVRLNPPRIPYLSSVTGGWATAEEVTDPEYWSLHLCRPVRFEEGVRELARSEDWILLEVGPGQTLSSYVKQHPDYRPAQHVIPSLPHGHEQSDLEAVLAAVEKLRNAGVSDTQASYVPASNDTERKIAAVWQRVLGLARVGIHDNFFDLGGNSLQGTRVLAELQHELQMSLGIVALFEAPTVSALAKYIDEHHASGTAVAKAKRRSRSRLTPAGSIDIAIIAMNGRFPGAANVQELWTNLVNGVESVSFFSDQELLRCGIDRELLQEPRYVKARPILADADLFDARFFGLSPREAELTDPQQRLLLQCAWEALELAGYDSDTYDGPIGMFAGMSASTYWFGLRSTPDIAKSLSFSQAIAGNDKDSLAPSVSYRLNLKGPSVSVQTHCSTSLVATHLACQSLLSGECDMALAGGVSVRAPQKTGYLYHAGGQDSADGHTRTFDRRATGTILGEGVGVVVLKRLEDALADGDCVYGVIKGSAINNDGAFKAGFAAPSVVGQAEAVRSALGRAGIPARSISYVEAHGSATEIGDPIEVAALTKAFREDTPEKRFCAIGSIKANVGHPDKAAGVAGLIKAALVLRHQVVPPNPQFEEPNPGIDFENSPFFVNRELAALPRTGEAPLRACVNSLGMGGTNAHVVLEEAPAIEPSGPSRPWHALMLSCKTPTALDTATRNLTRYLTDHPGCNLADVAFTLQSGRRAFSHRRTIVCRDRDDALAALTNQDTSGTARVLDSSLHATNRVVTFMFPGIGDHYEGMAAELYEAEPVFRRAIDECADGLAPYIGVDLREILFDSRRDDATRQGIDFHQLLKPGVQAGRLQRTSLAQTAVFAVEYALARLLMSWGVVPQAMIGYSVGEFVAATLGGVLSLPDALRLVASRALLIETLPEGAMLAAPLPARDMAALVGGSLSIAVCNSPKLTVVSGPHQEIAELERTLQQRDIVSRRLPTTHAFHSGMMRQVFDECVALVRTMDLTTPKIAYISNVTGTWIKPEEAIDPHYWATHMCQTVRFSDGIEELLKEPDRIFIEVGAGQNLGSFVKQHESHAVYGQPVVALMRNAYDKHSDEAFLIESLAKMWLAGVKIDWAGFYAHERRLRLALPSYPFELQRYWIEPPGEFDLFGVGKALPVEEKAPPTDWFYTPIWKSSPLNGPRHQQPNDSDRWIVFADAAGAGRDLAAKLRDVVVVEAGDRFEEIGSGCFRIDPRDPADYEKLLGRAGFMPRQIVHFWSLDRSLDSEIAAFYSLLYLAQALGNRTISGRVNLTVVTGDETLNPVAALVTGPCRIIPAEYPNVSCRSIGVDIMDAQRVLDEIFSDSADEFVAYRNGNRYIQGVESIRDNEQAHGTAALRHAGVYLITGGLGGIGLAMAEYLATRVQAKLVLVSRSAQSKQASATRKLEALGAEVLVVNADVADVAQMQHAVQQAIARFGAIHGVIHAAGVPGNGLMQLKKPAAAAGVLAPKVRGTLVLESALNGVELDFLALFSSITSITGGGPGQVDYCAANAFLDAYARANRFRHGRTVAIDWCEWQWDAWQEGLSGFAPEVQARFKSNREKFGLTFAEGTDAFSRVLSQERPHVIVSTRDLKTLIKETRTLTAASASHTTPAHARPVIGTAYVKAQSDLEVTIAGIWQNVLGIDAIGTHDNFFDLGGNSLIGLQLIAGLRKALNREIPSIALYEAPTVSALAKYLDRASAPDERVAVRPRTRLQASGGIAIIGMAGRFPGANDVNELWRNLTAGKESISFFSDEELLAAGVEPALLKDPGYVKAGAVLEGIDRFDAQAFGYSPIEAEIMDPQHRLFLECAWETLENGGYDPDRYDGAIGVFGGTNISTYLLRLHPDSKTFQPYNTMMMGINFNSSDSLTTKVSYKLNLKGPSVAVQTFCSTSAVAIHMACKSLQGGDCDMALAGGVRIKVPQTAGYLYEAGSIESPDGHCRAFDAKGKGALVGNGVALVLLKRLDDAVRDGDHIYAVVKGSAINNDGALKVGYTAPSVDVQAEAIATALAEANVRPDEIGYVEAHGTGTEMGDPIEMLALTKAFGSPNGSGQSVAIGSIKTNLGHLDRAAGVASLIKTALVLERKVIPPSLNFDEPNPSIDFKNSRFYVNTRLTDWKANGKPRRAAMNALGIGGTNVHFVLEQAPEPDAAPSSREWQLLLLSAKSAASLDAGTTNLSQYLREHPSSELADVAYTLQVGRRKFNHKRAIVCRSHREAVTLIESGDARQILSRVDQIQHRPVVMMFPGVGDQFAGMAAGLYEGEPVFRAAVDECCDLIVREDVRQLIADGLPANDEGGVDLRSMLNRERHNDSRTSVIHPAVFIVDYALAQLLMSWGIRPQALAGYSVGEYCAACLAGVLSLRDALTLVVNRARLIERLRPGAMLAISLAEDEVRAFIQHDALDLAAVNGPSMCVVSGTPEAIAALEERLTRQDVICKRVEASHAFHSREMRAIYDDFIASFKGIELKPPQVPYVSNLTGGWITADEVMDPHHWARHMCQCVRFGDNVETLLQINDALLLEVGPGQALTSIVKLHPSCDANRAQLVVPAMRSQYDRQSDQAFLLQSVGKLWLCGVDVAWAGFHSHEPRRRVPMPTYAFDRRRYWIEPKRGVATANPESHEELERIPEISDWFYTPIWKQSQCIPKGAKRQRGCWLLMLDDSRLGAAIRDKLEHRGEDVVVVRPDGMSSKRDGAYSIDPEDPRQYDLLLSELESRDKYPTEILHCWNLSPAGPAEQTLARGFYALMFLTQALGNKGDRPAHITIVTAGVHKVTGDEELDPVKATVIGSCRVIPQEYTNLTCRNVDVRVPRDGSTDAKKQLAAQLLAEVTEAREEPVVAYRGGQRWVQTFENVAIPSPPPSDAPAAACCPALRRHGVYLITGGFGGIGLALAQHLARTAQARLVLVGRRALPPREEWPAILIDAKGDPRLKEIIATIVSIEELGSDVLVCAADVAKHQDMQTVAALAKARFGGVNGVFHSAGVPGAGLIQLKTRQAAASVLAPKVQGVLVLNQVFKDTALDFIVLMSSMVSVVGGGPGQVDYSAANAFLDAFAIAQTSPRRPVVSIDWGEWQWDAWQEGLLGFDPRIAAFFRENRRKFGVSFEEGMESLDRILASGLPNVVVSTREFNAFIRLCKSFTVAGILHEADKRTEEAPAHPRPVLGTSYIAPNTELEQRVAAIWQETLRIDRIGAHDNFFELGGNSLLGIRVIGEMRKRLNVEMAMYVLYEAPTIGTMARFIESQGSDDDALLDERQSRGAMRRRARQYSTVERQI